MRHFPYITLILLAAPLAGCASGNVRSASSYMAPPSPHVGHPDYDPYAAYADANATWRPPVINRNGTIVKPAEPASQSSRPDYEHAPWAVGASGGGQSAPPGTF